MGRRGPGLGLLVALLAVCGACDAPDATSTPGAPEAAATASFPLDTPSPTATSTTTLLPPSPTAVPTPTRAPSPTATAEATPAPTAVPTPTREPPPTATATPEHRPAPAGTEAPPTPFTGFTDLHLGEPRYQPAGYALYSSLRSCFWHRGAARVGVLRTVFSEQAGELLVEHPLAPLDDVGYFVDFEMSESGRLMAASLCVAGYRGGVDGASDDAEQEIWVSRDGGKTWVSWGAVDLVSRMVKATDDDVAVLEQIDATSKEQIRWLRSGAVFPAPGAGCASTGSQAGTVMLPSGESGRLPPAPPAAVRAQSIGRGHKPRPSATARRFGLHRSTASRSCSSPSSMGRALS